MWVTCPLHAPGHQVTDLRSHLAPNRPQSLRGQHPWLGNGGGRGNKCFPTTFILYCKSQSQQMGQLPTKVQKLFGYPRPTPVELDPHWGHSPVLLDVPITAVLKGQGLSSVQDSFPTRCLNFVMYILGSSLLIICSTPSSCPCISPCLSFKLYQKLPYQASCNTKTLHILFNELNCPGTRQSSCGRSPDLWYRNVSQQHCTEFESKAKPSCALGIVASKMSGRARWLA